MSKKKAKTELQEPIAVLAEKSISEGEKWEKEINTDCVSFKVTAFDESGHICSEQFTVKITDLNEERIIQTKVVIEDAGDKVTYAISDERFEIVSGQLKLKDGVILGDVDWNYESDEGSLPIGVILGTNVDPTELADLKWALIYDLVAHYLGFDPDAIRNGHLDVPKEAYDKHKKILTRAIADAVGGILTPAKESAGHWFASAEAFVAWVKSSSFSALDETSPKDDMQMALENLKRDYDQLRRQNPSLPKDQLLEMLNDNDTVYGRSISKPWGLSTIKSIGCGTYKPGEPRGFKKPFV